jgi:hypothetical protein
MLTGNGVNAGVDSEYASMNQLPALVEGLEYSPQKCYFCSTMITSETFRENIKQDYIELEWMESL